MSNIMFTDRRIMNVKKKKDSGGTGNMGHMMSRSFSGDKFDIRKRQRKVKKMGGI